MTLLIEKGTFAKPTSTSTPVAQTITLRNPNLTPKIIICWTIGYTSIEGQYTDNTRLSYGWSDGTNHACQSMRLAETAENEQYVFRNDAIICLINQTTANVIISQATVTGTAAGSFSLSWGTQADGNPAVVHYQVFGGTDITNVSVVNTTCQDTATGNHSWTGSGTTFTPDFALTMTSADGLTATNTIQNGVDRFLFSIGAVSGSSNQWCICARDETATSSDCDMYIDSGACLVNMDIAAGTITYLANFVSFNSAAGGGITLNVSNGATSGSQPLSFLFVKGGLWEAGTFQQRSGTGQQDVTLSNSNMDPEYVFLAGINSASTATVVVNNYVGIGACDNNHNEGNCWIGNTNGAATFTAAQSQANNKAFRQSTPAATGSSSTTNAECSVNNLDSAGKFGLNWTTADTTLRRMAYWVVGQTWVEADKNNKTFIGSYSFSQNSTANQTQYWNPMGSHTNPDSFEPNRAARMRPSGTLSGMYVRLIANSITGGATTFNLRINGANATQTVSFAASTTGAAEDTTHSDFVGNGDLIDVQSVPGGSTGTFAMSLTSHVFLANNQTATRHGSTPWQNLWVENISMHFRTSSKSDVAGNSAESHSTTRIKKSMTCKFLSSDVGGNARTSTSTLSSRKNSANGNLGFSILSTDNSKYMEDLYDSDSVADGDDYTLAYATGAGSGDLTIESTQCTFISTEGYGYALTSQADEKQCDFGRTSYLPLHGHFESESTESTVQMKSRLGSNYVFDSLTAGVRQNTCDGSSTILFRKNAANGNQSVSIATSTSGTFSDTTNTDTVATTDIINYSLVAGGTSGALMMQYVETWYLPEVITVLVPQSIWVEWEEA